MKYDDAEGGAPEGGGDGDKAPEGGDAPSE
jgi:hypothetical protein